MRLNKLLTLTTVSSLVALTLMISVQTHSYAQNVSVVTLQVVPGQNGGQSVVTPKGMVVPLPGAGVNSNVVQIYIGAQGGYWYVDRNGQTVDLTQGVMRLQGYASQQPVPQYAPAPPPSEESSSSSSSSSSSGGGGSGLMTAAAAGMGAMAGAAIGTSAAYPGNYYRNVPYGTPVYYPHGGTPYYRNASGNSVNVEHNTNVNANYYNQHSNNFESQQNWYNNQQKSNTEQYKNWQGAASRQENPFTAGGAQGGGYAAGGAAAGGTQGGRFGAGGAQGGGAAGGEEGGRFGRHNRQGGDDGNAGGGRFGQGGDAGAGEGRFGNRDGGNDGAGRLGGGDDNGGGRFGNRGAGGGDGGGRFGNRGNGGGRAARGGRRR